MKFKIFDDGPEIDLDLFIATRALIWSNSGGGKSYTSRRILEETHGKVMQIIIDSEGEFSTLREKYEYLLVGKEGDVDISLKSANLLPNKILELGVSTIIDISELGITDRIRYVKSFLEGLMSIPRGPLWKSCIVFLDEIHNYAGQQDKQDSCTAVKDLASRGRKRGYCLVGCTQRIAKLHKDVAAELLNGFCGRTWLDIDAKRSADILGFRTWQEALNLRDLEKGEFNVFGPAVCKGITKVKISKSHTTHPEPGKIMEIQPVKLTDKIKGMIEKLNELPKEEAKKLKTIQDLQNEIRQLKAKKPIINQENPLLMQKEVQKAFKQGQIQAQTDLKQTITQLERNYKGLSQKMAQIAKICEVTIQHDVNTMESRARSDMLKEMTTPRQIKNPLPRILERIPMAQILREEARAEEELTGETRKLDKCAKSIYSLLYENQDRKFSKIQIAVFTGYKITSGGFNNALSSLRSKGLMIGGPDKLTIGNIDDSIATEQIGELSIELFLKSLPQCERKILEKLLENPNEEFDKEGLGNQTGYQSTSGGFNNALSRLNSLGCIERNNGLIKLNLELLDL